MKLALGRMLIAAMLLSTEAKPAVSQSIATAGKLQVYFIDVEGGQSTLFVTPEGESLLVDAGWPGNNGRDADRIMAVAKKAGIKKIDFLLITHYHVDHAGGIPQLMARMPIGTFLDHGPNRELDKGITEKDYALYQQELARGKSKVIHAAPGDVLPIRGMTATVISSDGKLIDKALPGAGEANKYCANAPDIDEDQTENSRSLGFLIQFGKLKILDLGDLTKDKEMELVCPANKLGIVDVYIVSHHGWEQSSSAPFVDAIEARIAIMENGAKKGGSTSVLQTIKAAPGLETLWQLHYSDEGGPANNTAAEYIANPSGADAGHWLEFVGDKGGGFAVVNERMGLVKQYAAP